MSGKFQFSAMLVVVVSVSVVASTAAVAQKSPKQLDLEVARTLDALDNEFKQGAAVQAASFTVDEQAHAACPAMPSSQSLCPNGSGCDCPACPECPSVKPKLASTIATTQDAQVGFVRNEHFQSPTFRLCDELADTMTTCLADTNIPADSRRQILQATMKLLVRNAELESQAQVAQIRLEHERELAVVRGNLMQMQAEMAAVGEMKTWMGPLYTNQNQTQQQINNLSTNIQLANRTLRLLEKEKEAAGRMQANQPLPSGFVAPQPSREQVRPERWTQLPSHTQPPARRNSDSMDKSTRSKPAGQPFLSSTTSRLAPPRLTDEAVRRQQLESHMRQLQAELDRAPVQRVGWEQPVGNNRSSIPGANQLRPMNGRGN